ncbi:MAG: hypothetical protein GX945_12425 [Lentisphaerae bacterium]|nr:hypothetical protein [Lentisphaerota bacterium]
MDFKAVSYQVEVKLAELFDELRSGISQREDSRAFGAMIEKRIADNWERICTELGYEPLDRPGRRTIFDFAFQDAGRLVGIDVKTKDLDSTSYSDGGICAVGNLLKFLANDKGVFLIAEFGHNKSAVNSSKRDIEYIRVAPFIMLPHNAYRIENLGTGQVRLNYTVNQVWDEIAWDRDITEFYDLFVDLAMTHYVRVSRDANNRIEALKKFKKNGYTHFSFGSH